MGFFSKKAPPKVEPEPAPHVPGNFQVDPIGLIDNLRAAHLEATTRKIKITEEEIQDLIDGWTEELVQDFEEALKNNKDTIYFFNHDSGFKDWDWLHAAGYFTQTMKSQFGLEVKFSSDGATCITIKTSDVVKMLEQPEAEKKFHQQGIYR